MNFFRSGEEPIGKKQIADIHQANREGEPEAASCRQMPAVEEKADELPNKGAKME